MAETLRQIAQRLKIDLDVLTPRERAELFRRETKGTGNNTHYSGKTEGTQRRGHHRRKASDARRRA